MNKNNKIDAFKKNNKIDVFKKNDKFDTFKILYISIFLIIIALPLIEMSTNLFDPPKLNEKRKKAEMPSFKGNPLNSEFISDIEDYFNDNYGFRDQFIMLNNTLDVKLLGVNTNKDSVIIGKNDYLYSAEELDDYTKTNLLEDWEIKKLAKELAKLQKDLKDRGIYFLFTVAPNKSTIYPEYMPFEENTSKEGNLDRLQRELDNLGVNSIDFKKLLLENKGEKDLYYKRDTHWNDIGSFLATEALLQNLSKEYPIVDMPKIDGMKEEVYSGDLDGLLGLKSWINEYKLDIDYGYTYKKLPKMISYMDSFSYNVLPKLDKYSSYRIDHHNIQADMHSNLSYNIENTKIIYFEIVERYLYKLLDYDFALFDDDLKELDEYTYNKTSLPLSEEDEKDIFTNYKYIEKVKNPDGSYYLESRYDDSFIIWYLPETNVNYLYLELSEPPKDISLLQFFWATEDEESDFTEEDSLKFIATPLKTKYLIDVRHLSIEDINRFRLDIGDKPGTAIKVNKIELY